MKPEPPNAIAAWSEKMQQLKAIIEHWPIEYASDGRQATTECLHGLMNSLLAAGARSLSVFNNDLHTSEPHVRVIYQLPAPWDLMLSHNISLRNPVKVVQKTTTEQPPKKMVRRTARFVEENVGRSSYVSALQLAEEFINELHASTEIIAVTGTQEEVLIVWEEHQS